LVLAIQMIDSRMPPTDSDIQLAGYLEQLDVPRLVVATKSDKLSKNQHREQLRVISSSFGGQSVVMSSAKTGAGYRDIWKQVNQAIAGESSIINH